MVLLVLFLVNGLVVGRLGLTCRGASLQFGPFLDRGSVVFALGHARHRHRRL